MDLSDNSFNSPFRYRFDDSYIYPTLCQDVSDSYDNFFIR